MDSQVIAQVLSVINPSDNPYDNNPYDKVYLDFFEKCFELESIDQTSKVWLVTAKKIGEGYFKNGVILMKQNRLQEALDSFHKAIQIIPEYSNLDFYRGVALSKQRRYEEAISSLNKAIELNTNNSEARKKLDQIELYSNQIKLKEYYFKGDVFTDNIPVWKEYLSKFVNVPDIQALEIGSCEGESACWLLDNVLTHPSARLTCVDHFSGSWESLFDFNIASSGAAEKVQKIKGISQEVLRILPSESYDIVYIDQLIF